MSHSMTLVIWLYTLIIYLWFSISSNGSFVVIFQILGERVFKEIAHIVEFAYFNKSLRSQNFASRFEFRVTNDIT